MMSLKQGVQLSSLNEGHKYIAGELSKTEILAKIMNVTCMQMRPICKGLQ